MLISLNELLELLVKVSILLLQYIDVCLKSCDFGLEIGISIIEAAVAELNFIKFFPNNDKLVISDSVLGL